MDALLTFAAYAALGTMVAILLVLYGPRPPRGP